MDVKQIREEITKIEALLQSVDAEMEKIGPEPVPPRQVVEQEYLLLLSALSSGPSTAGPFASLQEDRQESAPPGLDAFTFFGLLQAFIDDPIVISCLSRIFSTVVGVTATQLEDSLLTVDRITDGVAKSEILEAVVDRVVSEIESGKISDSAIIAVCCQKLDAQYSESIMRLLAVPGWDQWPVFVQVELAWYLQHQPVESETIFRFVECVLQSVCGENGSHLSVNTSAHSVRVAFQLTHLLIAVHGEEWASAAKPGIVNYVEKSLRSPHTLPGQLRQPTDLHYLVIQLARVERDPAAPVWTLILDKLSSGGVLPLYEVPGCLAALTSIRLTADNLFSNILSIKKRVASFSQTDLTELVKYLVLVGDKSAGAAVTKFVLERRDLFLPATGADAGVLSAVLETAAIASVDSGTVLPECVLLFKKFQSVISQSVTDSDRFHAVAQLLLPNGDVPSLHVPSPKTMDQHGERIQKCLAVLGLVADGTELVANGSVDGLSLDFVIPKHKTCILIERESVFNVSSKRATVSGRTALKANLMAQRKAFRVIVVIPELYSDDKALVSLLADPLRKVSPNSTVMFPAGGAPTANQRMALFLSQTESLVELSRVLFQILKLSVSSRAFVIENLVCGDQFLNLVLSEFLPTYVVKHKGDLTVTVSKIAAVSVDAVYKLVDQLHSAGVASGGCGVIAIKLGLDTETKNAVLQRWSQAHPASAIRLSDGLNGHKSTDNDYNIIYIS